MKAVWNFGIIGCGNVAKFHAQAIKAIPNAKLSAIYGRNPDKANAFAKEHTCTPYTDLQLLLSNTELDIVCIVTPSGTHLEPCMSAANAGKHIICEKPLEVSVARTQQMINYCKEKGVVLSGIFNRRFYPAVLAFKKAVEEDRFGQITLCEASIKWYRTQAYYDSGAWRGTKELDGGGALMNQGIHTIDLLLYLMGDVKRLTASTACLTHEGIEVEDTAVVLLEFVNGAKGIIQGSTSCWSSTGHPAEVNICGENGSVFLADDQFKVWDFKEPKPVDRKIQSTMLNENKSGQGANDPNAMDFIGHQKNIENVIDTLEGKADLLVTGSEALKPIKLINTIYESAANEGMWIAPN